MGADDDFKQAVAAGRRNADAMLLMHNWCAHARARRFGGIGLVEQTTGLPISHFSMECDHAPAGGMACWDFGESALDFYDRNCVTCKVRQPVALPNLTKLVAERDEALRIAAAKKQYEQDQIERALRARKQARVSLRTKLDAVNLAFLDDFEAYDEKHDDITRRRLVESAKMAPDRFDRRLIDLIFEQSGETIAIALIALDIGAEVAASEPRLLSLARRLFRDGLGGTTAVRILIANLAKLKDREVVELVPVAAELASPSRSEFFGGSEPSGEPQLLLAIWKTRPAAIVGGIDQLLERKTVAASQLVGRTIHLIVESDNKAAKRFVRIAASRYVRAAQLLPDLGEYENLGDLASALDLILDIEPEALDSVLQDLSVGATIEAKRNIAHIYAEAWRGHYHLEGKKHSEARLRAGLERLTWLPSQILDREVLSTVASAFLYPPDEAWPLIKEYADKLVGAALLLDEQFTATEARQSEGASFLKQLERDNLRSVVYQVAANFLNAAAKASNDELARSRFIEAVQVIPEERELLRGLALKAAMRMADDVAGLKAVLSLLYSALVGASVRGRAEAALALSEMPSRGRQNLPALVYEAFCALLFDPFVLVHKYSVRTARQISVPEELKPRVALALFQLINVYSRSGADDDFLVDCIAELARLADLFPNSSEVREFCCNATLKANPLYVRSESWSLCYALKTSDDFALVVTHVLPEYAGNLNQRDDESELIRSMTDESVRKHKGRLVEMAKAFAQDELWISTLLVDALYRAGAETEATDVLKEMTEIFGATIKDKGRNLFVGFPLLAYQMEEALVAGDDQRWRELADEWKTKTIEQQTLSEDRRARDTRSRFSIPD